MKIVCEIEGRTPLMLNRFPDEDGISHAPGGKEVYGQKLTPEQECLKKLYIGKDGVPYVPAANVLGCIREGGKFHKLGRTKITTRDSSLIPAFVEVQPQCIPIISDGGWSVDARMVCNQATKGRFIVHRPLFHTWKLAFDVELDEELPADLLYDVMVTAGKRCGLGTFTPRCKGPFGRFSVLKFDKRKERTPVSKTASVA